jgi:hypothetical protein
MLEHVYGAVAWQWVLTLQFRENLQADHHSHPSLSYFRVATPLKLIYSSIQISNLFPTVPCEVINFVCETFPLFFFLMSLLASSFIFTADPTTPAPGFACPAAEW